MPESSNSHDISRLQRPRFLLLYFLLVAVVGFSLLSSLKVGGIQSTFIEQTGASKGSFHKTVSDGSPDLLLSVPFYVYEEFAWLNATFVGRPVSEVAYSSEKNATSFKHGDDYWFLASSLRHPMRTRNISEAKIFFVPMLLNFMDEEMYYKGPLCAIGKCDGDLLMYTQEQLRNSPAFQQYPDRHFVVRSCYNAAGNKWNKKLANIKGYNEFMELFKKMHVVIFEKKDMFPNPGFRHTFPSYYVGSGCELSKEKPFDVAMIAIFKRNPAFKDRRNICSWLSSNSSTAKVSVCGQGDRCPALAQSKFGLHAPGDTWGSQRPMDTILSGTVPIFTHVNQYEILGPWIDWTQLSYYLPVHNDTIVNRLVLTKYSIKPYATQDVFLRRLQTILEDEEGYKRKHQAVLDHRPLFDYTTLYPFDTYMYLLQAELYPETRRRSSRWSALILPPPLFDDPEQQY
eukprot:scaffold9548_cov108-Cylindrotheca_fusiformis.AAC.6